MVTITAPGVEMNEIDLSQYDNFLHTAVETQNVFITGFASKGLTNIPYEFTNKNSITDLINTFGSPTNEAERYFFNACLEAIQREDVILYAVRLPYDNEASNNYNIVSYKVDESSIASLNTIAQLSCIADADGSSHEIGASKAVEIKYNGASELAADELTKYRKSIKKPLASTFMIVDKNQEVYNKIPVDSKHKTNDERYKIGILPIVTTAANAMYYQKLISTGNAQFFDPTEAIYANGNKIESTLLTYVAGIADLPEEDKKAWNLSKFATGYFPTININTDGTFDRNRLKHIGIVVFKGRLDVESGNKIIYEPVEAFAGSLRSDDVDPTTGASQFIDDIVNSNSKLIEVYSNCFNNDITIAQDSDKFVMLQAVDGNCSKYVGVLSAVPTSTAYVAKILGKKSYVAKVGDIAKYRANTTDDYTYYICQQITDKSGTTEDHQTWTAVSAAIASGTPTLKVPVTTGQIVNQKTYDESFDINIDQCFKDATGKYYVCTYVKEPVGTNVSYSDIGLLYITEQDSYALGFKEEAAANKAISYDKICDNLDIVFEKNKDRNANQIDIVVDAGVANIAQFNKIMSEEIPTLSAYDPTYWQSDELNAASKWKIYSVHDGRNVTDNTKTDIWTLVLKKYTDFCKTRGDCMFLADGLRPLCLTGNQKNVRKFDPTTTVRDNILPYMKFITGKIDTSYGAGNCDWYQVVDPTSEVNMWMPPSVKMMCSLLDTTNSKFYWSVASGVNNGKMNGKEGDIVVNKSIIPVKDIAFSPTVIDAGDIYTKSWNYATYYQDAGFCLEGQRTFQSKPTAFDRINVRRLFLYLERKTYNAAKYFIYEGNTAYTRQRLVDAITPFFEDAKINEGLVDYRIQCDDRNNTPDTIERNELHVKIAIKPSKAIEFIECTFVALRTGASFTEAGMND